MHIPGRQEHGDVEGLMEASKHKGYLIESEAAKALGEVRDARTLESLIQALKDEDDAIGEAANKASKQDQHSSLTEVMP